MWRPRGGQTFGCGGCWKLRRPEKGGKAGADAPRPKVAFTHFLGGWIHDLDPAARAAVSAQGHSKVFSVICAQADFIRACPQHRRLSSCPRRSRGGCHPLEGIVVAGEGIQEGTRILPPADPVG